MEIVEINGVKFEVDLDKARKVEQYRVGDRVKVLVQKYEKTYESYPGIIVGFEAFDRLPTIVVAYLHNDYSGADLKVVHFNNESSEKLDIAPMLDEEVWFNRNDALERFDREIAKKQFELDDLKARKAYFIRHFGEVFKGE